MTPKIAIKHNFSEDLRNKMKRLHFRQRPTFICSDFTKYWGHLFTDIFLKTLFQNNNEFKINFNIYNVTHIQTNSVFDEKIYIQCT